MVKICRFRRELLHSKITGNVFISKTELIKIYSLYFKLALEKYSNSEEMIKNNFKLTVKTFRLFGKVY